MPQNEPSPSSTGPRVAAGPSPFALPVWAWAAGPPLLWVGAAGLLLFGGSPRPWWEAAGLLRPLETLAALLYAANMLATSLIGRPSPPDPVPESPRERAASFRRVLGGTVLRLLAFGASAALTEVLARRGVPADLVATSDRDLALTSAMVASVLLGAAGSLLLRFAGPPGTRGVLAGLACLAFAAALPHAIWSLVFNLTLLGQIPALWGPPAAAAGVATALAWAVWRRRPAGPARAGSPALLISLAVTALAAVGGAAVSGAWAISQPRSGWREPTEVARDAKGAVRAWIAVSPRDGAPRAWLTRQGGAEVPLGRQVLNVGLSADGLWVAVARRLPEVELLPGPSGWLERFLDDRVRVCAGRIGAEPSVCSPDLRSRSQAIRAVPVAFHPERPRVMAVGADRIWAADLETGRSLAEPTGTAPAIEACWAGEEVIALSPVAGGGTRILRLDTGRIGIVKERLPCLGGDPLELLPAPPGLARDAQP